MVTSYQPNLPTLKNKGLTNPTSYLILWPTSHRHLTRRWAQWGLRVRVVPGAATRESTTQVRRSLLPSPQARGPSARWHAQGP
jgi:hypothetical protein